MLWGSRFSDVLDQNAMNFSSSLSFDINLMEYDIKVSKAHAKMLHKIGIIDESENEEIQTGLQCGTFLLFLQQQTCQLQIL